MEMFLLVCLKLVLVAEDMGVFPTVCISQNMGVFSIGINCPEHGRDLHWFMLARTLEWFQQCIVPRTRECFLLVYFALNMGVFSLVVY